MTAERDELSVLDTLDEILRHLQAFQSHVSDTDAIMHAAVLALEQPPEPDASLNLTRIKSLVGSAAASTRELLGQVSTLIADVEGRRRAGGRK